MRNRVWRLLTGAALGGVGALALSPVANAQRTPGIVPSVSRPVIQATTSERQRLTVALARLARNPRDVSALLEAGDAARGLNDFAAAIGFYRRADEAQPNDPRINAGLGSALVMSGDAIGAIPYFAVAEQSGALPSLIASDRGLAYDLVGDSLTAQRYYQQALGVTTGPTQDQVRNRLAVSQAITGQLNAAQTTLMPLLNKQDKPGWRTRAFTLAIAGKITEAVDTANKILPPQLAESIAPYLRYMPRLTKAQQAAAANLGRFPRASEIGHDDPRIAAYIPASRVAAAGSGLIPKGEPFGGAKGSDKRKTTRAAKAEAARLANTTPAATTTNRGTKVAALDSGRIAPPEPRPTIERTGDELAGSASGELPPVGAAGTAIAASTPAARMPTPTPTPTPIPAPTRAPTATSGRAPARIAATSAPLGTPARPGFDLSSLPASAPASSANQAATLAPTLAPTPAPAAAPRPTITLPAMATEAPQTPPASTPPSSTPPSSTDVTAPATPPPVPGPGQRSLTDIFADLGKPTIEAMPAAGAVDIRAIPKVRPKPAPAVVAEEDETPPPVDLKAKGPKGVKARAEFAKAEAAKEKAGKEGAGKESSGKESSGKELTAKEKAKEKAAAAKEKAKKPLPPSHPSRIWVQIGVGRNKDAIAFDWRRWTRQSPALFKGRSASISDMGRTNRVLVGPFETLKAAKTFVADAKKAGFDDALPWTSPAGQVVDSFSAK
ncbi:sporulation related protein [Novosphingobium sp. Rr 2-17]|uniref:SPOR domain-containing protein n=1 Tax=Novosphingobium sp. Rr 2-17 TaxID=555793 RepID=UPI000269A1B6|nr:SPOR domain-containing protein [Novosphingobium sp. Rr 2-17]EIZ79781.1 sporulation related protein [Novosphingobium sp. Rr 2-17]